MSPPAVRLGDMQISLFVVFAGIILIGAVIGSAVFVLGLVLWQWFWDLFR